MTDEKTLSTKLADFMNGNGYHVDEEATRTLRTSTITPVGAPERKIYTNGSNFVCAETDNKSYVALNKVHMKEVPTTQMVLEPGHGGRVQDAQNKTTEQLNERLRLIASDNGLLVAAKKPERTKA
jgi:hypothetical protein